MNSNLALERMSTLKEKNKLNSNAINKKKKIKNYNGLGFLKCHCHRNCMWTSIIPSWNRLKHFSFSGQCILSLLCALLHLPSCHCNYIWTVIALRSHLPIFFFWNSSADEQWRTVERSFSYPSGLCIYMLRNWEGIEETKSSYF